MPAGQVTAVVLCGGGSRRMDGRDKTSQSLAGTTVLDYLLDRLPAPWQVLCVGEKRPTTRAVGWVRESPPGGGPVAGMAAGLAALDTPVCVVVGGDMPFAAEALTSIAASLGASLAGCAGACASSTAALDRALDRALDGALDGALERALEQALEAVVGAGPDGRVQPLLAAYVTDALRRALPVDPAGARVMGLLEHLRFETSACDERATFDVDTPEALDLARRMVGP